MLIRLFFIVFSWRLTSFRLYFGFNTFLSFRKWKIVQVPPICCLAHFFKKNHETITIAWHCSSTSIIIHVSCACLSPASNTRTILYSKSHPFHFRISFFLSIYLLLFCFHHFGVSDIFVILFLWLGRALENFAFSFSSISFSSCLAHNTLTLLISIISSGLFCFSIS